MAGRVDLERLQQRAELLVGQLVPTGHGEYGHAKVTLSPETMLAMVAELRAASRFRDDVAAALAPGRWRGWDGPDGVDALEVIEDVAQALERHDQATGQPDPADGHADLNLNPCADGHVWGAASCSRCGAALPMPDDHP